MAFMSIHTIEGDPDELLARKRQHMDPVVERLAPKFGAIWSVTAKTSNGITAVNLWHNPEDAARFTQHPEAQQTSGLPRPPTFERFADVDYTVYQPT